MRPPLGFRTKNTRSGYIELRAHAGSTLAGRVFFVQLIPIVFFVVSSNLDNLVIGLSYGLKGISIGPGANLIIGLITLLGTVLSMGAGKGLLLLLPPGRAETVGSLAVLAIGLWLLVGWLRRRGGAAWPQEGAERFDRDCSQRIEAGEALALGGALTVNNMGLGIGASAMGLGVLVTSLGSCLCSILCLHMGNKVGRSWLCGVVGRYAEPASGLLVLAMGLYGLLK